jgi:hypothetical protein
VSLSGCTEMMENEQVCGKLQTFASFGKKKSTTGTSTIDDRVIGDILAKNMILIPLVIDPFGRFGPILQHFLFNTPPTNPITFTNTKPKATLMYSKIMQFPSPKGVLTLAVHNWKTTST